MYMVKSIWEKKHTIIKWWQGSRRSWKWLQSYNQSFNLTMKEIGWWWSCGDISWSSNSKFCLYYLRTLHIPDFCWIFLIIAFMSLGYWCLAHNIDSSLLCHSTNPVAVISIVALIREQIHNEGGHFRIEFIHSTRFVVMCRIYCPRRTLESTFVMVSCRFKNTN